jgi:hypothetical protein
MRKLLVAIALTVATPAIASNWTPLGEDVLGAVHYIDKGSIRKVGAYVAIWEKIDYTGDRTTAYREDKALWYFKCDTEQRALKSLVTYMANGNVRSSDTWPDYSLTWKAVVPDTVGADVFKSACEGKS